MTPEELQAVAAEVANKMIEHEQGNRSGQPGLGMPMPPTNAAAATLGGAEMQYRRIRQQLRDPDMRRHVDEADALWFFKESFKNGLNKHGSKMRRMSELLNGADQDNDSPMG